MATFAAWVKEQEDRQDAVGYFASSWAALTPGRISTPGGIRRHLEKIEQEMQDHPDRFSERQKAGIGAAKSGFELAVKEYHAVHTEETAAQVRAEHDKALEELAGRLGPVDTPEPPPGPSGTADGPPQPHDPDGPLPPGPSSLFGGASPAKRLKALAERGPVVPGTAAGTARAVLRGPSAGATVSRIDAVLDNPEDGREIVDVLLARLDRIEALLEKVWAQNEAVLTYQVAALDVLAPEPTDWDALYRMAEFG